MMVPRDTSYLILGVVCALLSQSSSAQNCTTNLVNKAVYEGTSASFDRVNDGQAVQWQVCPASNSTFQSITHYDDTVTNRFKTTYAVNQSQLTIFNSTVNTEGSMPYSTAGLYVLVYNNSSCKTAAGLIVIKNGPVCISNPNTLFCQVEYAKYDRQLIHPIMIWKNSSGVTIARYNLTPSLIKEYNYSGQYRAVSKLSVSDNNVYECQLTFSEELDTSHNPFMARNAPDFTASCNISTSNISITPNYGPKAGGTVLTIVTNWTSHDASVTAVYVDSNLKAECYNSSEQTVLVKTPTIENETMINQTLPITLTISSISNITTGQYFTYKPDPRVDDVKPRELSISGGTTLSISGYSLDSVANYPLIRAAVIITNNSNITYYNETYASCQQTTENGTKMVCTSPPIYIRHDFLQYLYDQANPNTTVSSRRKRESFFDYPWQREDENILQSVSFSTIRSKRSVSIKSISTNQTYTLPNSQEQMVIYLGIVFDVFKRYENNSLRDSSGNFALRNPPNISCSSDIQIADGVVTIQGNGFMQCCKKEDYTIRIGNGSCNIQDLTDNALTFYPPKNKPPQTMDDTLYCGGDKLAIFVKLKIGTWGCSCLKYPDGEVKKLIIITVTTVGSVLLPIAVVTVILVILRKRQKAKSPTSSEFRYAPRAGYKDTSFNSQPTNDMQGTPEDVGSVYYSTQIQAAYLGPKSGSFGLSYQMPSRGSSE